MILFVTYIHPIHIIHLMHLVTTAITVAAHTLSTDTNNCEMFYFDTESFVHDNNDENILLCMEYSQQDNTLIEHNNDESAVFPTVQSTSIQKEATLQNKTQSQLKSQK